MELTQELVLSLKLDTITKKDYDLIIKLIENKVDEIWKYICKEGKFNLSWWAFSNDEELGNGNGSTGGYFDPDYDMEFIELIGHWKHDGDSLFYNGFPTSYLWSSDYKQEVQKQLKLDAVNKKESLKKKQTQLKKRKETKQLQEDTVKQLLKKLESNELLALSTFMTGTMKKECKKLFKEKNNGLLV